MIKRDDDTIMEFGPSREGLYFYDFRQSIRRKQEQEEHLKVMMVKTVEEIKRNYTKKEIEAADEARRLYVIVGRPSQKVFEEMIKTGRILNTLSQCRITEMHLPYTEST